MLGTYWIAAWVAWTLVGIMLVALGLAFHTKDKT